MFNKLKSLVSKIRYINRVILTIEQKENKLLENIRLLENSQTKLLNQLDQIMLCQQEGKERFETIFRKNTLIQSYINEEYLMLVNDSRPKVLLAGFYGAVNLGDELMMWKVYHDLNIDRNCLYVLMCDNANLNVFDYTGVNILHYPKTKYDFNFLAARFNCLIFGGGAILDDCDYSVEESYKYDMGKIFIELSSSFLTMGKQVYTLGVSTNTALYNSDYLLKLQKIVEKSSYFSVRDTYSAEVIKKYVGKPVNLINDIVLTYEMPKKQINRVHDKLVFGIIWICQSQLKDTLLHLIDTISAAYIGIDLEIRLIPFYDYNNCDSLFYNEIMKERSDCNLTICHMAKGFDDVCSMLVDVDFVISMRYHGALLGLALGCKTIGYLFSSHRHYNNKMQGLFEKFNCRQNLFLFEKDLLEMAAHCADINQPELKAPLDNTEYYNIIKKISVMYTVNYK